jgi:hypothetical protein
MRQAVSVSQAKSPMSGTFGSVLLVLVGLGLAYAITWSIKHDRYVRDVYRQADCTVLDRRRPRGKDSAAARIDVSFVVDGKSFSEKSLAVSHASDVERFAPKQHVPCFYDPADPNQVVVEQEPMSTTGNVVFLIIASLLVAFGLRGILWSLRHIGKSPEAILAEHLMSQAHRPRRGGPTLPYRAPPRSATSSQEDYDDLPLPKVVTLAGKALPVRLVRAQSRVAELGLMGFLATFWNGIVGVFVVAEVHLQSVFVGLFLVPFVAAGVLFLWMLVRRVVLFAAREPVLEIDAHPLRLGGSVNVSIMQRGPLQADRIRVAFRGTEEATQPGKNSPTLKKIFLSEGVIEGEAVRIGQGESWNRSVEITLPDNVPPSFKSNHNTLRYELVVTTMIANLPDDENVYPVLLLPAPASDRV